MAETVFYNSKTLAGIGLVGIGTTNPVTAIDAYTGTINTASITVTNAYASNAFSSPNVLTDTLTVNGNTSVVGNVTVTSDVAGSSYVTARRVPAGSLDVTQYVTGSVPLTTTTNLIQNYLSNAATITANTSTGTITQALSLPGTSNSGVRWPSGGHSVALANLALSNLFIEAWVNPSVTGSTMNILQRGTSTAEIALQITGARDVAFVVSNTSTTFTAVTTTTPINAGTWYHVSGSYQRTGLTAGTVRVFVNGTVGATTATLSTTQPLITSTANVWIGTRYEGLIPFFGNVADVRVWSGGIVPTATFASPAAAPFGSTQPSYLTGTPTLLMSLNSQYFPGVSTSPYGPVLTLPGTVGSYYSITNSAVNTNWQSNGFCVEAWVNFASFANAGYTIGVFGPTSGGFSWSLSPSTTGTLIFSYYNSSTFPAVTSTATITTGSWNHIVAQSNGTNIWLFINGVVYLTAGTAISGTAFVSPSQPLVIGQQNSQTPANFAITKARLVFGNDTSAGSKAAANVYSSGNFTASPNFAAVPAGATVAWQLDSQYPLPTYPSFFDVPVLSAQTPAYGAEPVPVGGVTSNVLSPYSTTYPQLDSIRFDGTGYIDYGNAASSALTTNLWATPWTIEGWVYPTSFSTVQPIVFRPQLGSSSYDLGLYINQTSGTVQFASGGSVGVTGSALPLNTWTHVAVTWDGTRSNIYQGTSGTSATIASKTATTFNAWAQIGFSASTITDSVGNLTSPTSSGTVAYTTSGGPNNIPSIILSSASWLNYTASSTAINLDATGGATVAMWVKFNTVAASSMDALFYFNATNASYGLYFDPDSTGGQCYFSYTTGFVQFTTSKVWGVGIWNHLTVVVDNSTKNARTYVNGVLNATSVGWPTQSSGYLKSLFRVGAWWNPPTNALQQPTEFADIRVYDRVLTAGEISIVAAQQDLGVINQTFNPTYPLQFGSWQSGSPSYITGNLADVRVSNVARYTGSTYTVPSAPFVTDRNTLLLLKSLGQQTGTTLQVQGRGLNAVSLGATRSVQSYPPAPMSSYLLDTTSNASVTYGEGKYIVSASSERTNNNAWMAYTRLYAANGGEWQPPTTVYASSGSGPGAYTGSVTTVDALGNSYAGEWLQMQLPVSVLPSSYTISISSGSYSSYEPGSWVILGSRDGINWSLVATRTSVVPASWTAIGSYYAMTVNLNQTQAYNYWRIVVGTINSNGSGFTVPGIAGFVVNGLEESLCVTSDSKVGVGIANPQRALEVAGDLVVSGTISGGAGMGSFRNRIINGDFSIDQRNAGASFIVTTAAAKTYTLDRWFGWTILGSKFSVQQTSVVPLGLGFKNSVLVTSLSGVAALTGYYYGFGQYIEGYNIADLNWGTSYGSPVTVSFWVRSSIAGSYSLQLGGGVAFLPSYIVQYTVSAADTWQQIVSTIPPPPSGYTANFPSTTAASLRLWWDLGSSDVTYGGAAGGWVAADKLRVPGTTSLLATYGATMYLTGVQLEKGTVATPFEVRNYAQELQLCQRYYQQFQGTSDPYHTFALGQCVSGTQAWTYFRFLQPMRTPPTLTSSAVSNFCLNNSTGGVLYPLTALAINANDSSGVECARLDATASTAVLTAGNATLLRGNNTTSAYIGLNAEL